MTKIDGWLDLLNQVSATGQIRIVHPKVYFDQMKHMQEVNGRTLEKNKEGITRYLLEDAFFDWNFMDIILKKKTLLRDLTYTLEEDDKYYILTFDWFEFIGVPKENVQVQMQEIKDFFNYVVRILTQEHCWTGLLFVNNHDRQSNRTYGEVLFYLREKETPKELNAELMKQMNDRPTVKKMFDMAALRLNKIGRYARGTIRLEYILPREEYAQVMDKFIHRDGSPKVAAVNI